MRTRVIKALRSLDACAVENVVGPGTPDIAYIGGWIECKKTKDWPKRATTPVRLDHELLPSQKVWIRRHEDRGGKAYVLLQIAREFLLLPGTWSVHNLGQVTKDVLVGASWLHCHSWAELEEELPKFLTP